MADIAWAHSDALFDGHPDSYKTDRPSVTDAANPEGIRRGLPQVGNAQSG